MRLMPDAELTKGDMYRCFRGVMIADAAADEEWMRAEMEAVVTITGSLLASPRRLAAETAEHRRERVAADPPASFSRRQQSARY